MANNITYHSSVNFEVLLFAHLTLSIKMNGDFGSDIDQDNSQQESLSSPAMRHCAPTKQPLKSESGKHWSKSRREVLGSSAGPKAEPPVGGPKLKESGSQKVNMPNIYEKQISYKYLPLELASATTVKNSIAKNILFQSLGHGLLVIKFGEDASIYKLYLTLFASHHVLYHFRTARWS